MTNLVSQDSFLLNPELFKHAHDVANLLASSNMLPEQFRNNIPNCVIGLNYAARLNIDPMMCMQKMCIVMGKPTIEAQLKIALFNANTKFSGMSYKMSGEGDTRECVAWSKNKETGEVIEGPVVSINMAKKEGWWTKKKNGIEYSKWQSMPELMLRYRAGSFFINVHSPETALGLHTTEELRDSDIIDVTPEKDIEREIEERANSKPVETPPELLNQQQMHDNTPREDSELFEKNPPPQEQQQADPGF